VLCYAKLVKQWRIF